MRRGHSLAQPLRFPVASATREIVVQQRVEQTEGRAEWISTSSPSQCPGEVTPSSCPSESLSLQGPRELLFIHLLLLLVDAGIGNGISPVERRNSVEMAEIVPAGAWLSMPRDSRSDTRLAGPLQPPQSCSLPQSWAHPPNSCRKKSETLRITWSELPKAQSFSSLQDLPSQGSEMREIFFSGCISTSA